jgi:hypothetical protein
MVNTLGCILRFPSDGEFLTKNPLDLLKKKLLPGGTPNVHPWVIGTDFG